MSVKTYDRFMIGVSIFFAVGIIALIVSVIVG